MRDDVFGSLASFRMLSPGPKPTPSTLKTLGLGNKPDFSSMLEQANAARAAKPYVSPLKAQAQAQAQRAATAQPHRPTTTSGHVNNSSVETNIVISPPRKSTPPAPVRPPDAPQTPQPTNPNALALGQYPHPNGDNGRGMHWAPKTSQSPDVVDRFVAEAQRMGVKWVTFLNKGTDVGENDYLVQKLVGAGIEPVMRLYSPTLQP